MKYGHYMELFISREQESRGWLRDLKCVWQEPGPLVPAAGFLNGKDYLLVTDTNYSKCKKKDAVYSQLHNRARTSACDF